MRFMAKLSVAQIRRRFETGKEFNEIFDAFEVAIRQRIQDIDLYKLLFWNPILTPDEVCLFGETLVREFGPLGYETYMWLAEVFEVSYSMYDNYELALEYYMKASSAKPEEPAPYLDAADCYEPDLNIPPVQKLIEFLKQGAEQVVEPKPLYERLMRFYDILGNDEMRTYYRRKAEERPTPPPGQ
jgi:tetratricopeptide (TPR) repeat protein